MGGAQERAIGFWYGTPERSPDCGASPGAAPWMARRPGAGVADPKPKCGLTLAHREVEIIARREAAPRKQNPKTPLYSDREGRSERGARSSALPPGGVKMGGAQERAIGFWYDTPERSPDCGASPGAAPWMARRPGAGVANQKPKCRLTLAHREAAPRKQNPRTPLNSDREGRSERGARSSALPPGGVKMGGAQERAIGFGSGTPERSPDCGAPPEPGHGWPAEGSGGGGPETEMQADFSAPRSGDHRPAGCGMTRLHELFGPTFLKERWEIISFTERATFKNLVILRAFHRKAWLRPPYTGLRKF
jgi:hypothetical protein